MGAPTSVRRALCGLGAVLFVLSLAPAARAQYVGYVYEIGGGWELSGRKLSQGHQLADGDVVSIPSPAPSDHIVILDNNGRIFGRRRCSVPGECSRPIVMSKANRPRQSSVGILFDAVTKLLWGDRKRYILMRSRKLDMLDTVVRLDGGKIDLGPALKSLKAGEYHLRMREIARDEKEKDGEWLKPFSVKWDKASPAAVEAPSGLRPGLYEVALFNYTNGAYMPTGQSAWVLVSEGAAFEKASAAHQEAFDLVAGWGDAVSDEVALGFVLAHLSYLSRQAAK